MSDEEWQDFTSAFHQAIRPDDAPARAGKRILTIGLSAIAVVALAALLIGAFGGGRAVAKPGDLTPVVPSARPNAGADPPAGSGWTGLAGPTCASDQGNMFAVYGYYTGTNSDQTTGWSTSAKGGYSGGSCTGGYLSMPVSGRPDNYDSDRFVLYRFDFSSSFASASCRLGTYVPDDGDRARVGGDPAYFYYFQTDYVYGSTESPLGGYLVSQVTKRGRWVNSPSFKVTTGTVTVKLVDAGARDTTDAKDAHIAVAQVRITCQSL
ncbi:hypothetical protein AB0E08_17830 [Streptomyces sp. NPDC048281]|uniref:hypothetical protein n=1 Tax=Streptomyces sp. NPDC048281 TaxID=3154715 RepID=UPI003440ED86